MNVRRETAALNAICPYYTMFPLDFPLRVLRGRVQPGDWVVDPFSGRGTTNYASRLLGIPSLGIDSSPVAAALTGAKLANTTPNAIVASASRILESVSSAPTPMGPFWRAAYHPTVLDQLCRLRAGLLSDSRSQARVGLRAVLLGALHGPLTKSIPSYFSNQCPRTYAPKPRYALKYWKKNRMSAPQVDVIELIRTRATRFYSDQPRAVGTAMQADSRCAEAFSALGTARARWIVTSPPYYGMRTYIPDQWLRNWFLGGPDSVDYSMTSQLEHGTPEGFTEQLTEVWTNLSEIAHDDARLVIRFGGIRDRKADPLDLIKDSFSSSPWVVTTLRDAGTAAPGRRQAAHFRIQTVPRAEYDIWARLRD